MLKRLLLPIPLLLVYTFTLGMLVSGGCASKQPGKATVPGAINSLDQYSFRVVSDAQAAIVSVRTWEACSDAQFPATVTFDTVTATCDKTAGPFPASIRAPLATATKAYNVAAAAGQAYHSGASSDTVGLTTALTQLSQAIASLLTSTGGK